MTVLYDLLRRHAAERARGELVIAETSVPVGFSARISLRG